MAAINSVHLIGNTGKAERIELRYTEKGVAFLTFSLAVEKMTKDKDAKPNWFDIVAYGKQAETIHPMLKGGDKVAIEGRLEQRVYEKKDGSGTAYSVNVIANDIQLLGSKKASDGAANTSAAEEPAPEEDYPF
jgi:single-strand DNA-binding protein